MIGRLVHVVRGLVGIVVTYLQPDGAGKATLDPAKICIGPRGGASVHLAEPQPGLPLAICEGIETGLAYMALSGFPTWAAISADGICSLVLPDMVRDIVIAADNDVVGLAAERQAKLKWTFDEGRRVAIELPPGGCKDFNDLIRQGGRRAA